MLNFLFVADLVRFFFFWYLDIAQYEIIKIWGVSAIRLFDGYLIWNKLSETFANC